MSPRRVATRELSIAGTPSVVDVPMCGRQNRCSREIGFATKENHLDVPKNRQKAIALQNAGHRAFAHIFPARNGRVYVKASGCSEVPAPQHSQLPESHSLWGTPAVYATVDTNHLDLQCAIL